jgi:hypothetical protein
MEEADGDVSSYIEAIKTSPIAKTDTDLALNRVKPGR